MNTDLNLQPLKNRPTKAGSQPRNSKRDSDISESSRTHVGDAILSRIHSLGYTLRDTEDGLCRVSKDGWLIGDCEFKDLGEVVR